MQPHWHMTRFELKEITRGELYATNFRDNYLGLDGDDRSAI